MRIGPTRPLPLSDARRLGAALEKLSPRERLVLELRYGLRGARQHSLAELGHLLRLSSPRVRQLETRALEKLAVVAAGKQAQGSAGGRRDEGLSPTFRNQLRPCVLLLLREQPTEGYGLVQRLHSFGFSRSDPGRVYRVLGKLEAEGLVRSGWKHTPGTPRRRIYELTKAGMDELDNEAEQVAALRESLGLFLARYRAGATKVR
jgi:poly-beta-hydroxybutyrate-responsive repressor